MTLNKLCNLQCLLLENGDAYLLGFFEGSVYVCMVLRMAPHTELAVSKCWQLRFCKYGKMGCQNMQAEEFLTGGESLRLRPSVSCRVCLGSACKALPPLTKNEA